MEAAGLCTKLLMDVLVLLVAHVDHGCFSQTAAFPRVHPDRLQFFEYERLSIHCDSGSTEWRLMRRLNKITVTNSSNWNSSAPSCTFDPAFETHSGEYWCEDAEGRTGGAVNIVVTAGSVILDAPARPVLEGHNVTLRCRNKETQPRYVVDFYKDGFHLLTSYENKVIIEHFSESAEGLYKCKTSAGESPESWLAVKSASEDTRPSHSDTGLLSLLWAGVLVALLPLAIGPLLCRKHREGDACRAGTNPGSPDQSVYSVVYYRVLTTD